MSDLFPVSRPNSVNGGAVGDIPEKREMYLVYFVGNRFVNFHLKKQQQQKTDLTKHDVCNASSADCNAERVLAPPPVSTTYKSAILKRL